MQACTEWARFPALVTQEKVLFLANEARPQGFSASIFLGISPGNEVAFWPCFMNPSFIYQACSVKLARNWLRSI